MSRPFPTRVAPLLLALAASCALPPEGRSSPAEACRVAPDGGPPAAPGVTDRGIGGTGAPAAGPRITDKGIGGTGVVGVITGFASICLDGLEVDLPPDARITIDAAEADASRLRAGQMALITAAPAADGALVARSVTIRHAVSGPVELVSGGEMLVAGQRVVVSGALRDSPLARAGKAVAVSGVHRPDGAIVATRLDPARDARVTLRGPARRGPGGALHIGRLELPATGLAPGWLEVEGHYAQGRFVTDHIQPSPGLGAPGQMFGAKIGRVIAEAYIRRSGDRLELSDGVSVPAASGLLALTAPTARLAVVTLDVKADGSMIATDIALRSGGPGEAPSHNPPVARGQAPQGPSGPAAGQGPAGPANDRGGGRQR